MIVTQLQGGLGNQMFQLAFGLRMASERGGVLFIDTHFFNRRSDNPLSVQRQFELDAFKVSVAEIDVRLAKRFYSHDGLSIVDKIEHRYWKYFSAWSSVIQNANSMIESSSFPSSKNLYLSGRWQSHQFFAKYDAEVRALFSPAKLEVNLQAKKIANQMRNTNSVAVHVRRRDYVTHPVYSQNIGALSQSYYEQAMQRVRSLLQADVDFYFVSDDIEWCEEKWGDNKKIHFTKGTSYISDIWLLTQSDHCIISNSTFAWWGGFLGHPKRIVIAPGQWARSVDWCPPEIIPEKWETIKNTFELK
jgi:hypothetical protein